MTVAVNVVEAPAVVGDGAANRLTADAPVLTASSTSPVDQTRVDTTSSRTPRVQASMANPAV